MKICIISINAHTKSLNFACPIHSWAFQQFLLKHGIKSTILDYKPNYHHTFNSREPIDHYVKLCDRKEKELAAAISNNASEDEIAEIKKKLERLVMLRDGYSNLDKERAERFDKIQSFVDHHYIKTDKCYNTAQLEVEDLDFDCYICASDVIWKCPYPEGFDLGYTLFSHTMENKWKISYAASRGVPRDFNEDESNQFTEFIKDIDYLSVREESLKNDIKAITDRDATVVLDPVLLHDAEFYEKVLIKPKEDRYVLLYYPEERTKNAALAAEEYAAEHGLKIVELSSLPLKGGILDENHKVEHCFRYGIGPEEWLGYLKYAECVFTNSFHAICFCILFKNNFQVGSRNGDKVFHILNRFELSDRIIEGHKPLEELPDYTAAYKILQSERKKSEDFILSALQEIEGKRKPIKHYHRWQYALSYRLGYNSMRYYPDAFKQFPSAGRTYETGNKHYEYKFPAPLVLNNGTYFITDLVPEDPDKVFKYWKLRIRIVDTWYDVIKDGRIIWDKNDYKKKSYSFWQKVVRKLSEITRIPVLRNFVKKAPCMRIPPEKRYFYPGDPIPYIPVNQIESVIAYAEWKDK